MAGAHAVFDFTDYKSYLKARIEESRGFRGYQSQLAKAAGCQRSFLSQVLNGPMDLSREHAAELTRFFGFTSTEAEYFVGLVDYARAGSKQLKEMTRERLAKLRETAQNLSARVKVTEIADAELRSLYYSSWYWSAIHVMVAVPRFQTPQAIADRLGLPLDLVKTALVRLEEAGLVERTGNHWRIGKRDIHLHEGSALTEVNHTNWRQRALINAQLRPKDALHYTSVFTMSRDDAAKLRDLFLNTIVQAREAIGPSPSEELYCYTSDFFRV